MTSGNWSQLHPRASTVRANSMEGTFCDKVFALCDYYLSGSIPPRQSRHIYDLKKLSIAVQLDRSLLDLMAIVREQRVGHFGYLSADPEVCVPKVLKEIARMGLRVGVNRYYTPPVADEVGCDESLTRVNISDTRLRDIDRFLLGLTVLERGDTSARLPSQLVRF